MIELNNIPLLNEEFIVRKLGDELLILSIDGDELHTLDEIGTLIWHSINGENSIGDIIDNIFQEYEVEKDIVKKDVLAFVNELISRNLIKIL